MFLVNICNPAHSVEPHYVHVRNISPEIYLWMQRGERIFLDTRAAHLKLASDETSMPVDGENVHVISKSVDLLAYSMPNSMLVWSVTANRAKCDMNYITEINDALLRPYISYIVVSNIPRRQSILRSIAIRTHYAERLIIDEFASNDIREEVREYYKVAGGIMTAKPYTAGLTGIVFNPKGGTIPDVPVIDPFIAPDGHTLLLCKYNTYVLSCWINGVTPKSFKEVLIDENN